MLDLSERNVSNFSDNTFFMKNFFYKNVRLKNDQSKIVLRILPEAEERCKRLFLDTAQNHGNNLFLVFDCQCNIAVSFVHVQLCFKIFLFTIIPLSCWSGERQNKKCVLSFRLEVSRIPFSDVL